MVARGFAQALDLEWELRDREWELRGQAWGRGRESAHGREPAVNWAGALQAEVNSATSWIYQAMAQGLDNFLRLRASVIGRARERGRESAIGRELETDRVLVIDQASAIDRVLAIGLESATDQGLVTDRESATGRVREIDQERAIGLLAAKIESISVKTAGTISATIIDIIIRVTTSGDITQIGHAGDSIVRIAGRPGVRSPGGLAGAAVVRITTTTTAEISTTTTATSITAISRPHRRRFTPNKRLPSQTPAPRKSIRPWPMTRTSNGCRWACSL